MLVFDSSLDHQHSTVRKFARRWFGPYVVVEVHENGTYTLRELDGTQLRIPVAGKRIKAFKRRDGRYSIETTNPSQVEDADSEIGDDEDEDESEPE